MVTTVLFFFITSLLSWVAQSVSDLNPTLVEIIKILFVSVGWIGGLIAYIWMNEKRKLKHA